MCCDGVRFSIGRGFSRKVRTMDAYTWALVGVVVFGVAMTPVIIAVWCEDRADARAELASLSAVRVAPVYQPVTEDIAGSVGIMVARTTGRRPLRAIGRAAVVSVYVYAARHASQAWERPSNFVKRHRAGFLARVGVGRAYHDTLSSTVRSRDWVTDTFAKYEARHGGITA